METDFSVTGDRFFSVSTHLFPSRGWKQSRSLVQGLPQVSTHLFPSRGWKPYVRLALASNPKFQHTYSPHGDGNHTSVELKVNRNHPGFNTLIPLTGMETFSRKLNPAISKSFNTLIPLTGMETIFKVTGDRIIDCFNTLIPLTGMETDSIKGSTREIREFQHTYLDRSS